MLSSLSNCLQLGTLWFVETAEQQTGQHFWKKGCLSELFHFSISFLFSWQGAENSQNVLKVHRFAVTVFTLGRYVKILENLVDNHVTLNIQPDRANSCLQICWTFTDVYFRWAGLCYFQHHCVFVFGIS